MFQFLYIPHVNPINHGVFGTTIYHRGGIMAPWRIFLKKKPNHGIMARKFHDDFGMSQDDL